MHSKIKLGNTCEKQSRSMQFNSQIYYKKEYVLMPLSHIMFSSITWCCFNFQCGFDYFIIFVFQKMKPNAIIVFLLLAMLTSQSFSWSWSRRRRQQSSSSGSRFVDIPTFTVRMIMFRQQIILSLISAIIIIACIAWRFLSSNLKALVKQGCCDKERQSCEYQRAWERDN